MRLIDADKLVKEMKSTSPNAYTVGQMIYLAENAPTAFDMDKAIKKIGQLEAKAIPRYKGGSFGDYEGTDYYVKKNDVLEILKCGL